MPAIPGEGYDELLPPGVFTAILPGPAEGVEAP